LDLEKEAGLTSESFENSSGFVAILADVGYCKNSHCVSGISVVSGERRMK
jgi:hypothetical protein